MENIDENHNPLQESSTQLDYINLTYNDVPEYLRSGELFHGWTPEDSTTLSVPAGCFKPDDTVHNVDDLAHLFKTLDYWGVSNVPGSAFDFCNTTDSTLWESAVSQFPGGEIRKQITYITVQYRDIPLYLRTSEFFLSLSADDENEEVSIPQTCFKMDDTVNNVDDLGQLLRVVDFWGIERFPNSVLDFCGKNAVSLWEGATSSFAQDCNIHKSLTEYFKIRYFAHWWNRDSFAAAVDSGRIELIEHWIARNLPESHGSKEAAQFAAERDDLKALQILRANAYPLHFVDCARVAEKGHIGCLKYVRDNGATVDENCCYAAARSGHLECLRYLIESDCPRGDEEKLCAIAAERRHNDCYRYLYSLVNVGDVSESFDLISDLHMPLEELQMLRNNGAVWDESVSLAALCRDLPFLQYVMQDGCPHTNDMILRAAAMSRKDATFLAKLRFLVEDMFLPLSSDVFTIAVMFGSIDAVQFLLDVGCPCEFVTLPYSVDFSLDDTSILENMEYATSHGCSVPDAFLYFVHNNHLPICQANYLPPTENFVAIEIAGEARDWDNLETAVQYIAAARNQHQRIRDLLYCSMSSITSSLAIIHGSVECLFHLVDVGCPCVFEVPLEFMMPDELDDARIAPCLEYALERGGVRNETLDQFVFGNDLPLCQAWLSNN